jgi:uncharacterized membrane protein (UPF0127 family)
MKFLKAYLLPILILTPLISCKESEKKIIKTTTVEFKKEGSLQILQQETDSLLVRLDIEIADNEYETATGLMYRSSMEPEQGMLFVFEDVAMRSFYMKNTEFPLDIIFLDNEKRIASFQKNAQPYNETGLSSKVPAKYVLEVNAGMADKWSLNVGDRILYEKE